ncbi:MAG: MEDS domain-containing protein, partial [Candidatus Heimdallarchaeota archaeon]|nr:MEDS domain-containing protein [Candidatus Heimdallarchaeota archaeon]MCK4876798.1 MEDS domain-containing protein [Candidatus Heimdallarchaeota archaeon]
MPAITENKDETETNSDALFDFSGRFDDLGEDLLKLSSQEHICTIYRKDEDKIDSIMEFLKTGIVKNERCVIIVDKNSKEAIQKKMKSMEDIKNLLNTSAIVLVDSEDIYGNRFDFNSARAIESVKSYFEVPQEDNFNGLRIIIDILPVKNKDTTMNMSLEFHSSIDKLISNRNINFFCLYDEYKFESKTLLNVIISHSKIIFNGFLCENSFSMNPHQLQIAGEDRVDDTLYKKTVYDIVQREINKQKRVKTDSYVQKETLKGINDSVFILDFEGNILEVNEVAYKTRGYTEEEILSLNILDIMSSENKDLFDSRIEELKEKREITFETTHYCKNGTLLDVEFKTKIISYDNQEFILSVGRDITERKRVEKEAKTNEEKYR